MLSGVEARALCRTLEHCHVSTRMGLLVPVKCKATDILYICVLETVWTGAHMDVMVRCPQSFSHIVYNVVGDLVLQHPEKISQ